jgi:hypothetical protein
MTPEREAMIRGRGRHLAPLPALVRLLVLLRA